MIVLLAGVLVSNVFQAGATHQPADKAAAAGSSVREVKPTGTPILTATMKTSKPQDLIFQVTLECSIITQVANTAAEGAVDQVEHSASSRIRVWVTIDNKVVPINSPAITSPPAQETDPNQPSPPGGEKDKVTFCSREHKQQLTNAESPNDGVDRLRTYLNTKAANAFNWVYLNAGSAVHTIKVFADIASDKPSCAPTGDPAVAPTTDCTDGFVGARVLVVEPHRFANDAVV